MRTGRKSRGGFSFFEIMLATALAGIVSVSLISSLMYIARTVRPKPVAIKERDAYYPTMLPGGEVPTVPSQRALSQALPFHIEFARLIDEARAVYVFGAQTQDVEAEDVRYFADRALSISEFPEDLAIDAGLQPSAYGFYQEYIRGTYGRELERHAEDFTVVTVGEVDGVLEITGVAQHRRIDEELDDEETVVRQSRLWCAEGLFGYDTAISAARDANREASPGAAKFWLRFIEPEFLDEGTLEEGLVVISWPDPEERVGGSGNLGIRSMPHISKYTYATSVSRE